MDTPESMQGDKRVVKRRQNVACDACKLRRVKCDLALLQEPSSSTPELSCSSCARKGIRCTTVKNKTKAPPRRTGARIEAAKRQHGEVVRYDISDSQGSSSFSSIDYTTSYQIPLPDLDLASWTESSSIQSTADSQLDLWLSQASIPQLDLSQSAIGYNLAGKSLSTQLSRILIREYFDSMHYQTPAIDPEEFVSRFKLAGEMPEHMGASEATCAMLECWGARFSMHPAVLGMVPDNSIKDVTAANASRLKWGVAREAVCRALIDRARSLLDKHAIMRKPSLEGIQAMFLLQTMLNSSMWVEEPDRMAMLELHALHSAIASHSDALDLRAAVKGENCTPDGEMQAFMLALSIPASRLYRTIWVNDAMSAASGRRLPQMREETVTPPFAHHTRPTQFMSMAAFDQMASLRRFMGTMMTISTIARQIAREISYPASKPGLICVEKLCKDARRAWEDLDDVSRTIRHCVGDVAKAAHVLPGFSPLNWLVNVRSCMTHLTLVVHAVVMEQRDFQNRQKQQQPSGTLQDLSGLPAVEPPIDFTIIEQLSIESVDRTLEYARDYALFVKSISNTDILAHAGVVLRGLAHVALALSEIPSREQGYIPTRAGTDWTWDRKLIEIGWCIQGLYLMGWAWGDVSELVTMVQDKIAEHAPTAEQAANAHVRDAEGVPISHCESEPLLAFYPPVQVIPSFASAHVAVDTKRPPTSSTPPAFDMRDFVQESGQL